MMSKRRIILWAYRPAPTCLPAQTWLPGTASVQSMHVKSVRGVSVFRSVFACVLRRTNIAHSSHPSHSFPTGVRFQEFALIALQEAAEDHLVHLFEDTNLETRVNASSSEV